MPDPEQIPHLLRLLDDDSETVRKAVAEAFAAFGTELENWLDRLPDPPDAAIRNRIQELLDDSAPGGRPESGTGDQFREGAPLAAFPSLEGTASVDEADSLEEAASRGRLFKPGQLVKHARYNYRGVVVAIDLDCQAPDGWYFGNRTQPERDQPWYHILVHGSEQVTYAAQTSLAADPSGDEVTHPLVSVFFSTFEAGAYVRNDRPWPKA